jgi:hypothetical protein
MCCCLTKANVGWRRRRGGASTHRTAPLKISQRKWRACVREAGVPASCEHSITRSHVDELAAAAVLNVVSTNARVASAYTRKGGVERACLLRELQTHDPTTARRRRRPPLNVVSLTRVPRARTRALACKRASDFVAANTTNTTMIYVSASDGAAQGFQHTHVCLLAIVASPPTTRDHTQRPARALSRPPNLAGKGVRRRGLV